MPKMIIVGHYTKLVCRTEGAVKALMLALSVCENEEGDGAINFTLRDISDEELEFNRLDTNTKKLYPDWQSWVRGEQHAPIRLEWEKMSSTQQKDFEWSYAKFEAARAAELAAAASTPTP